MIIVQITIFQMIIQKVKVVPNYTNYKEKN